MLISVTCVGERKDFEVYSCDVSPDGKRLVTAAGGELGSTFILRWSRKQSYWYPEECLTWTTDTLTVLDGYVRIWSTEAIYNTGNPEFANKPKQLASMSNHSGTIHTVRFSPNGKYLASGADDKIVCVYTLDANPPTHSSTFGRYTRESRRLRWH